MTQLSTGDMLRAARTSGTEMGKRVAEVMDRGDLVTDEIVIGLIEEKLENDQGTGFIFDGFPRTLAQADALGALLTKHGKSLDAVIELEVNDEVLVGRIVNRAREAAAAGQPVRAADNEESLRQRLMEFYKKTSPLTGYYYAKGQLSGVDGLGEIETVAGGIKKILDSL